MASVAGRAYWMKRCALPVQEHGQAGGAMHAPDLVSALPDGRSVGSTSRGGSLGSQSLGSLGGVSRGSLSGWGGGGSAGGGAPRRPTSMRPSMEMRRRKLDTSMLQVPSLDLVGFFEVVEMCRRKLDTSMLQVPSFGGIVIVQGVVRAWRCAGASWTRPCCRCCSAWKKLATYRGHGCWTQPAAMLPHHVSKLAEDVGILHL